MKTILRYIPVLFLSLAATSNGAAQASDTSGTFTEQFLLEIVLGVALAVSLLVLVVLIVMLNVLKSFVSAQKEAKVQAAIAAGEEVEIVEEESFWSRIYKNLTDSVPIEREDEVLTDHAYDGIRELDNKLPPWWLYMFYGTIAFAVFYLVYFHVLNIGPSSDEEYRIEMAAAQEQIEQYRATLALNIDETNVEITDDAAVLAEAKGLFEANCVACHAADGGGGVGPNFTDQYWIHGGDVKDIFKIIKVGVPQKGMISWQAQFTPQQMQGLASYILTFQGTTPANPKEAQGELYEAPVIEEEAAEEVTEVTEEISMK